MTPALRTEVRRAAKVKGVREDISGPHRLLKNGSRGPRMGDGLPSKLAAPIVEAFITNRETKARRGQFTSLNCEFTSYLSKGVLHIIANPCPPLRPPEQGQAI